jgi:F0F1-type ATP synthase delta subunit
MDSKIDLSEFFITKKQANDFIISLSNIIDKLFEINFNLESALSNELGIEKKDKFINLLRDLNMHNSTNEELKNLFLKLQDNIRNMPIVILTVAFEPNQISLKELLDWFLFNIKKQILIDIQIDKKLIAGATISYNGKFKDYSIRPFFNQLINQKINPETSDVNNNTNQNININI